MYSSFMSSFLLEADNNSGVFGVIFALIFLGLAGYVTYYGITIVPQSTAIVIERIGKFDRILSAGPHWKWVIIDRVAKNINLKDQVVDFQPQTVITKDNVRMQIDTVVFYQITDCKLYTYGITDPLVAIENLTATTLRNIIGELDLDQILTSRDIINTKMRSILDEATDQWGIKVKSVELKNIIPPREIQDAMEKQMKAERERREAILRAEGEKNSTILVAEGKKQEMILAAEAEKESAILRAEAVRVSKIKEAEGEAEAILQIQEATAKGIEMINNANPGQGVISIKSLEALEKLANGKSTKIIIPSEIQGMAGLATSLVEVVKEPK
jgi:regulator of protease activity HflC (stomatin/prohibitin superfamily)